MEPIGLGQIRLLSCIFGGLVAGGEVPRYLENLSSSYGNLPSRIYSDALAKEESFKARSHIARR